MNRDSKYALALVKNFLLPVAVMIIDIQYCNLPIPALIIGRNGRRVNIAQSSERIGIRMMAGRANKRVRKLGKPANIAPAVVHHKKDMPHFSVNRISEQSTHHFELFILHFGNLPAGDVYYLVDCPLIGWQKIIVYAAYAETHHAPPAPALGTFTKEAEMKFATAIHAPSKNTY